MKRASEPIKIEADINTTWCVGIAQCIDNTNTYCYPLTLSVAVATISVTGNSKRYSVNG